MNQEEGKNFIIGTANGIVAALIGSLVWKGIAISTGRMYGLVALIIAVLTGACFGYPTRGGNRTIRGLTGAVLGLSSIMLGYYFLYTSSIEIGQGISLVPASTISFGKFWSAVAGPVDYIFLFIGAYAGAKLGSIEETGFMKSFPQQVTGAFRPVTPFNYSFNQLPKNLRTLIQNLGRIYKKTKRIYD